MLLNEYPVRRDMERFVGTGQPLEERRRRVVYVDALTSPMPPRETAYAGHRSEHSRRVPSCPFGRIAEGGDMLVDDIM